MNDVTYILVPGLNDQKPLFQQFYGAIRDRWRHAGMHCTVVSMNWENSETYADKKEKVVSCIAAERRKGRRVVLVGISAGASLAMAIYGIHHDIILGVVSVGGLLALAKGSELHVEQVNKSWFRAAQACENAVAKLTDNQKKRILTFSPLHDSVIDPERQRLQGARNRLLISVGHVTSIALCLFTQQRVVRRFVERLLTSIS